MQQKAGTKRVMLVENSLDPQYRPGVLCYMYYGTEDTPSIGCEFYEGWSVEDVKTELEVSFGFSSTTWVTIPDAEPGCREDRVSPIPAARS